MPTPDIASKLDKNSRRRLTRWGILSGNLLLLLIIGLFVVSNRSASQTVLNSTVNSVATTSRSLPNPLDQLSSDQIAYQAAQMTKLAELTIARNRADSAAALLAIVPNDSTTLSKPQVVNTAQKSRLDIVQHRVGRGDTVTRLANKYHVSANSIRWSNELNGNDLVVGSTVYIPPAEGIVYRVKDNDTIDSIVNHYQANRNTFVTVNDAEDGVLRIGELVWVPNATQPTVATPALTYQTATTNYERVREGGYVYSGPRTPNGYDYGWCTWWAAHRYNKAHPGNSLPPSLGDGYSWGPAAQQQGLTVSFKPRAGAALAFPGRNHVAYVENVKANGDVEISEMNAIGWNIVSSATIPASQAGNYKYIY